MSRKYFWLKLKEDFFDEKQTRYLRSLPDGDKLVITYLKMQLKSLKTDGIIRYDRILPSSEEELALMLDEEINTVKFTINALLQINAIEILEDNTIYMIAMQELIGKETDSAERVRRFRENKVKALHCNATVTECNADVTKCNVELEQELNIEQEKRADVEADKEQENLLQMQQLFSYIQKKGFTLSDTSKMSLLKFINEGRDIKLIKYAVDEAVENNAKKWSYIDAILNRYKFENYKTLDEVINDKQKKLQNKLPRYSSKELESFYIN